MEKISTCLWFDDQAEEAMKFYTSIFKKSKKGKLAYYGENMPGPKGKVMTATFTIEGRDIMALNGGPQFKFNESVSFIVNCKDQKEIDYYWKKLTSGGGEAVQCGWLKDKYGVSWQIVPASLPKLLSGSQEKTNRVMAEVMKMVKLDVK